MELAVKTWICETCGYRQDFEPTTENMMAQGFGLIESNRCPSCIRKNIASSMVPVRSTEDKIVVKLATDEDIEGAKKVKTDENGDQVAENGKAELVELTNEEKENLKKERDEVAETLLEAGAEVIER